MRKRERGGRGEKEKAFAAAKEGMVCVRERGDRIGTERRTEGGKRGERERERALAIVMRSGKEQHKNLRTR